MIFGLRNQKKNTRNIESEKTRFSYSRWNFYSELGGYVLLGLMGVLLLIFFIGIKPNHHDTQFNYFLIALVTGIGSIYTILLLSYNLKELRKNYLSYNFKAVGNKHSIKKKWILFKRFHKETTKQWIIVTLISVSIFLPVRLLFWTYVSHSWLGNLGVMSLIAVILFLLIHYNKIGIIGTYFRNKITRVVFSRIGKFGLIMSLIFALQWGMILFIIDRGEFHFEEERNLLFAHLVYVSPLDQDYNLTNSLIKVNLYPSDESLIHVANLNRTERLAEFETLANDPDLFISSLAYVANMEYGAWGSHIITIYLVEELEAVSLFFFYRKVYYKKLGESWKVLSMYEPKLIKKFAKERI